MSHAVLAMAAIFTLAHNKTANKYEHPHYNNMKISVEK